MRWFDIRERQPKNGQIVACLVPDLKLPDDYREGLRYKIVLEVYQPFSQLPATFWWPVPGIETPLPNDEQLVPRSDATTARLLEENLRKRAPRLDWTVTVKHNEVTRYPEFRYLILATLNLPLGELKVDYDVTYEALHYGRSDVVDVVVRNIGYLLAQELLKGAEL